MCDITFSIMDNTKVIFNEPWYLAKFVSEKQ